MKDLNINGVIYAQYMIEEAEEVLLTVKILETFFPLSKGRLVNKNILAAIIQLVEGNICDEILFLPEYE